MKFRRVLLVLSSVHLPAAVRLLPKRPGSGKWACAGDDECNAEFVSKYGILTAMDVHPLRDRQHDTKHLHAEDYELVGRAAPGASLFNANYYIQAINGAPNQTVYVISTVVKDFIANVFPHIKSSFVLVTGDALPAVPTDILNQSEFTEFIEDPLVLHWFAQNGNSDHHKFTRIPNGLDYHMRYRDIPEGERELPLQQEALLKAIRANASDFAFRNQSIAVGPFSHTNGHRKLASFALANVPPNATIVPDVHWGRLGRAGFWQRIADHQFVASPRGAGWDCHRTWEALVLGTVPILDSTGLDPLWSQHGLPVVVVPKWNKVLFLLNGKMRGMYEELQRTMLRLRRQLPEPLKLRYWLELIDQGRRGSEAVHKHMERTHSE